MATFTWYVNNLSDQIQPGSGLGFYGDSGFGASVQVGQYQGRTYTTDSTGTLQGVQGWNVMYSHPSSGVIGATGSGMPLLWIPNGEATVVVRFTHGSAVRVENAKMYCYDRVSFNNPPSGVTCKGYALNHVSPIEEAGGSGASTWTAMAGSGSPLTLPNSPGLLAQQAKNGTLSTHQSTTHDFFVLVSASPDSLGSKSQFGLAISAEYY